MRLTPELICVICSDSQSALIAIEGSGRKDGRLLDELRKNLAGVKCSVLLQRVPGHCGLIGNDWADEEAGKAAISTDDRTGYQGISFRAARSLIIQEITDPPDSHERTKAVYSGKRDRILFPRNEAVLLAQLRSGHCKTLAAYSLLSVNLHHSVLSAKEERRLWNTGFRNVRPQRDNAFTDLGERRLRYQSWWNHPRLY